MNLMMTVMNYAIVNFN